MICISPKYVGITGVIDLYAIGKLNHVTACLAAVNDLVSILNTAGMVGMHHGDFYVIDSLRAAFVHGRCLFHAFFRSHPHSSGMPTTFGSCFLAISTASPMWSKWPWVQSMTSTFLTFFSFCRTHGISHDPGIDQD